MNRSAPQTRECWPATPFTDSVGADSQALLRGRCTQLQANIELLVLAHKSGVELGEEGRAAVILLGDDGAAGVAAYHSVVLAGGALGSSHEGGDAASPPDAHLK